MGWGRFFVDDNSSSSRSKINNKDSFGIFSYLFSFGYYSYTPRATLRSYTDCRSENPRTYLCPHKKVKIVIFGCSHFYGDFCECSRNFKRYYSIWNDIPFKTINFTDKNLFESPLFNFLDYLFISLRNLFGLLLVFFGISLIFWIFLFCLSYVPIIGSILDTLWMFDLSFYICALIGALLSGVIYLNHPEIYTEIQVVDWDLIELKLLEKQNMNVKENKSKN